MNSVILDKGWSCADGEEKEVSLPFSAPADRDVSISIPLPIESGMAVLEIDGAKGGADVYVGGQCVAAVGERRAFVDISKWVETGAELALGLPAGGGIAREVILHSSDSFVTVRPYGVFVSTASRDGVGAALDVTVELENRGAKRKLALEFNVLNHRGKRVSRKRKFFTFGEGERTVSVPVGMRRALPYLPNDPYLYTMSVSVVTPEGEILDTSEARFGVTTYGEFSAADKLVGCTLAHSCGVTGDLSYPESEMRKLSALSDLGYNTVRYIGCPSENALAVTDDLGLRVIVDLFDNWSHPRGGTRDHATFASDYKTAAANAVRALRNHPSVIMYSLGNAPEESYGRAGCERAKELAELVRELDGTRPVTASLTEFVPLASELRDCGAVPSAIDSAVTDEEKLALGREVGVFEERTRKFAELLDVCGYAGHRTEYPHAGKPAVGLATREDDYFDAIYDMAKSENIIGDLSACGMDCRDGGKAVVGDVDATSLARGYGLYRSVMLGGQPSFMLTTDDESADPQSGKPHWNWQDKEEGSRVFVHVFTAGDVVALYLNGELVGRKLAGRVNKYIASFEVEYRPGLLEAVVFTKGYESDRCSLETTDRPFRVKLMTGARRVSVFKGDLAFADVWVMDREGRVATDSDCELTFEFTNCEVVALGNAEGMAADKNSCVALGGHALVVVRATCLPEDGRLIVKADGEGLRAGRLVVRVKE